MTTEITSISELEELILQLDSETTQLYGECNGLNLVLKNLNNYENINVSDPGNKLGRKICNTVTELETIVNNLKNYIRGINELDEDNFTSDENDRLTEKDTSDTATTSNSNIKFYIYDTNSQEIKDNNTFSTIATKTEK